MPTPLQFAKMALMQTPTPSELARATGISIPYASQIMSDKPEKARTPPRSLAIHIFRQTGWRHPLIADLTDGQIAVFEEIEPWRPKSERAA